MESIVKGQSLSQAAARWDMDEKTARKYVRSGRLPSEMKSPHDWRTRVDPFEEVWPELKELLAHNSGLQANTLFEELGRRYPGRFQEGQLRTLQRKMRQWRALEGPPKEVFFAQDHHPGQLCASDFCHLSSLGVLIQNRPFDHLLFHFVLTYSNWETGSLCFSESFESLSQGLQLALWELGGVPERHRTDSLTAAVQAMGNHAWDPEGGGVQGTAADASRQTRFTGHYTALLDHYSLKGEHIQAGQANENGDVEQSHNRFKVALDQALMLRGSRNFESREAYAHFVNGLFQQVNRGRQARFEEERLVLSPLPATRLDTRKQLRVRVGPGSTIRVQNNAYSVPSRLIGEWVDVRLGAEDLEVWFAQKLLERLPRLRGEGRHSISYRHVIDWLVRKPGAFANYRYQSDLFPSSHFRLAYDHLVARQIPSKATKIYLALLHLAARESQEGVESALRVLRESGENLSVEAVRLAMESGRTPRPLLAVGISPPRLSSYDALLARPEVLNLPGQERGSSVNRNGITGNGITGAKEVLH